MIDLIVLAAATSAIVIFISKSILMSRFVDWVSLKNATVGEVLSCHHCLTHWLAAPLVLIYKPLAVFAFLPLDLFVAWAALVTLTVLFSLTILRLNSHVSD